MEQPECIFLSKQKSSLAYDLRCVFRKNNIYVELCRFTPEMLNKINNKTVAILIDINLEQGLKQKEYFNYDIKRKLFFLENKNIFNANGDFICDNFEDFAKLNIFKPENLLKQMRDPKELINNAFCKLEIKVNKWQGVFLKEVLLLMHKLNVPKCSLALLKQVNVQADKKQKDISYLLRHYIREIYQKVYSYKGVKSKYCYMYKVINLLYDIAFNEAE